MSSADHPVRRAAIVAPAGPMISEAERRLWTRMPPAAFILFRRNCADPDQLRALVTRLKAISGRFDAPVLIDQEGGRVMRMAPPHWQKRPAAGTIGRLALIDRAKGIEAAWLHARLIASDLYRMGITVNCAPVLDLAFTDTTTAIGDRAYGGDPVQVAELARAAADGYQAGGILPVIKHLPGHGRALVDSHLELPVVDCPEETLAASDWRPFSMLADLPFGMSAHLLFSHLDPHLPATLSIRIIQGVIREKIGFKGVLISDDLSMGALCGSIAERTRKARSAGCDLALHCNGDLHEMEQVLESAGPLEGELASRFDAALARRRPPQPFDAAAGERRLHALLHPIESEVGAFI